MNRSDLRPYRSDLEPNFFSTLREYQGFTYQEQLGFSVFWPGCSLASYSRELTTSVYDFLRAQGIVDSISISCCGSILRYSADHAEQSDYESDLIVRLLTAHTQHIITACPSCYYALRELLLHHGIEVRFLSQALYDLGLRITPPMIAPATSVCLHDSCPDRHHGVLATSVRSLFSNQIELREKRHHGTHSHCCGAGRLMATRHPERSEQQRQAGLEEFAATEADLLITYCVSCANAFQEPYAQIQARHYLELLFGVSIDWQAVAAAAAVAAAVAAADTSEVSSI